MSLCHVHRTHQKHQRTCRVDGVTRIGGGGCIRERDGGYDGGGDCRDGGDAVGGRGDTRGGEGNRGGGTGGGGGMGGTRVGWGNQRCEVRTESALNKKNVVSSLSLGLPTSGIKADLVQV